MAGYFLARCTQTEPASRGQPPRQLGTPHWRKAYLGFYDAPGDGRDLQSFSNSLKNSRDGFVGHFSTGRVGWRAETTDREPRALSTIEQDVFDRSADRSDEELWAAISPIFQREALDVPSHVLDE
jgi:hypothetical protein